MSDNPYSPPSARLGGTPTAAERGGLGDFDVGRALSDAWANTWENFPLWLGAGLVWGLALFLSAATVVGLILWPALIWGGTWFVLRLHDGGAEFGDVFAGFSRFGESFGALVALILAILGLSIAASAVQFLGAAIGSDVLAVVGYLISIAFNLIVMPRLYFAFFYVVDQGETGIDALRRAWAETEACKWKCVLIALLAYPIMFAGLLLLLVGVIPAMMIWYLMYTSAYRQIAGKPGEA